MSTIHMEYINTTCIVLHTIVHFIPKKIICRIVSLIGWEMYYYFRTDFLYFYWFYYFSSPAITCWDNFGHGTVWVNIPPLLSHLCSVKYSLLLLFLALPTRPRAIQSVAQHSIQVHTRLFCSYINYAICACHIGFNLMVIKTSIIPHIWNSFT